MEHETTRMCTKRAPDSSSNTVSGEALLNWTPRVKVVYFHLLPLDLFEGM